jgi:hypothetical protein
MEADQFNLQSLNDVKVLDSAYPEIHTEFIQLKGQLSPALMERLNKQ